MANVILDITMSLDGFIARPNDDVSRLHDWLFNGDIPSAFSNSIKLSKESAKVFDELAKNTGAIIAGRKTYEVASGWGGSHPFPNVPMFVLSHNVPKNVPQGSTRFTFVTDGIESAVKQAKKAAGKKNVYVLGGASVAQQCLTAVLLDEMMIHVVPVLLGNGIRLFDHLGTEQIELESTRVIESPGVTHLRFRAVK